METASTSQEDLSRLGTCLCCLDFGNYKHAYKEYTYLGETEVYADMISQCFDIDMNDQEPGTPQLICNSCIIKVRTCVLFKDQILNSRQYQVEEIMPESEETKSEPVNEVKIEQTEYVDLDYDVMNPEQYEEITNEKIANTDIAPFLTNNTVDTWDDNEAKVNFLSELKVILTYTNAVPIYRTSLGEHCAYCGVEFQDPEALREHSRTSHFIDRTKNLTKLLKHQKKMIKLDVTELVCTICDTHLSNWAKFFEHFEGYHEFKFSASRKHIMPYFCNKKVFICAICESSHKTLRILDIHMNVHFQNFICSECGKAYATHFRLCVHVKTHAREQNQECNICHAKFNNSLLFKMHMKQKHRKDAEYQCKKCQETFKSYFHKYKHKLLYHKEDLPSLPCEHCGKIFHNIRERSIHVKRIHLKEKRHQCNYCGLKITTSSDLMRHIRRHHLKLKMHKCNLCGKHFGTRYEVKQHSWVHMKADHTITLDDIMT